MAWTIEDIQQEIAALDDRALFVTRAEIEGSLRRRFYPMAGDESDAERFILDAIRVELVQRNKENE